MQQSLWKAERPIAILGGPGRTERASAAFARFAERFEMTVVGSFRRASVFDGEHDNYAGEIGLFANPKLKARIESADVVMLVGGRMSEAAAQGYTLFDIPDPQQRLIHVHADPHEIGRNYRPISELSRLHQSSARPSKVFSRQAQFRGHARRVRRGPTIWPGASRRRQTLVAFNSAKSCSYCVAGFPMPSSRPAPATSPSGSAAFCAFVRLSSRSGLPPARWALACLRQ